MAPRHLSSRIVALLFVLTMVASACAATATITPSAAGVRAAAIESSDASVAAAVAVAPEVAPEVWNEFSDRIDFRLTRNDVDCTGPGVVVLPNTQVWSAHYVVDGKLGELCGGRTNVALVDAWKLLVRLTPPEHLKELGIFVGYTNSINIGADESYVGLASSRGWRAAGAQVSIDIDHAFADQDRLAETLVHEMGHVFTAARNQTSPALTEAECGGWSHAQTCYNADALFLEWSALFWGPDMLAEVEYSAAPTPDRGRDRCQRNPGFWTAYSANNPDEDFATSYEAFVFGYVAETPEQQAKLDWFARNPELALTRDYAIQAGFGPLSTPPRCA